MVEIFFSEVFKLIFVDFATDINTVEHKYFYISFCFKVCWKCALSVHPHILPMRACWHRFIVCIFCLSYACFHFVVAFCTRRCSYPAPICNFPFCYIHFSVLSHTYFCSHGGAPCGHTCGRPYSALVGTSER